MPPERKKRTHVFANLAFAVLGLGFLTSVVWLNRYPGYSGGDVFFAYPALKAAKGGLMTYTVAPSAPFHDQIWAYHGPVLPHLLELCFRLFGFSVWMSRFPNVLGGWLAVLLLVIFCKQRGYRHAGLLTAVLWCGDRAVKELMTCRMDGLALLTVVVGFVLLERAWREQSLKLAAICGVVMGFSVLIHPLCLVFAVG